MNNRELTMDFAGSLVRHLGLQMYAGAVPAIAELVANAYDADASEVQIDVPLDAALEASSQIVIRDDGLGMTFEDVNDKYLLVGRDRRASGTDRSPGGRLVLGRKGLGKLAGFGIAKVVTVTTVNNRHLTSFRMSYDDLVGSNTNTYRPVILEDRPLRVNEIQPHGTEVRLTELQLKNRISAASFRRSMGRRFSILGHEFRVLINGEMLTSDQTELQFRYPEDGLETVDLPGVGTVQWWVGFTEKPLKNDDIRGVSVLSRGKLVQTPFFFDMSGGTQNQLGLQYLTGEVFVDGLDSYTDDLIATDRATVLWEHPIALPILEWGQSMLRDSLRKWASARAQKQKARLRTTTPYMDRIDKFPERQQKELLRAIQTLADAPTMEPERLDQIVEILLNAYENEQFFALLKELSELATSDQKSILDLMGEWDILEAVQAAQLVRGRVVVIQTLRRLIKDRAPEKPTMQDLLREHPWIIDPMWQILHHERSLETVLRETFHFTESEGDQRRLDFLCLGDSGTAIVVEVKRPGDKIGLKELGQLRGYVNTLRDRNDKAGNFTSTQRSQIVGVMIYSELKDEPGIQNEIREMKNAGYRISPWDHLLEAAERLHREYLDVITERAPQDDPRIQAIQNDALRAVGEDS
ncbi:ATP-binding protein [Arthrobacter sp. Y-9]|uniref:ATP-binding protein n=1 Tax=Arthrobacter sp. Y-9 TaxID=3039385 RepID=UPI00241DE1F3|nr:ATP-binding protein [Arthrobacter sp. Y-9]WFR84202.1 ATP-binding protein [Arthrobacter sp. Y-9]